VRALGVRDIPVRTAVDPDIEAERPDEVGHRTHEFLGDHFLLDHRHVAVD
jgi:hypothetical protein